MTALSQQATGSLDQTPLRPNLAAQRDVQCDHFFCAFKRELGPFDALLGEFHGVVHEFLTAGGRNRSLMPGDTGAA